MPSNRPDAGGPMRAVTTFTRSRWRRDWRAFVLLTIAVAISAGLVMTAAVGARRAGSAWDRFARDTRSPDVFMEVPVDEGDAALADVLNRHGVRAAALMGFMLVFPEGRVPVEPQPPGGYVGLSPGFGTAVYAPLILSGRAANPERAEEFTIDEAMARLTGLTPGDSVMLSSVPEAVHQRATVVGIHAGPLDITLNGVTPSVLMTPAFGAAWFDTWLAALPAKLRAVAGTVDVLADVPERRDREALFADSFVDGRAFGVEAIAGLDTQRTAFVVLAIAGAVGILLAAGQAVSRRVRREADQLPILAALGLTPRGRQAAIAAAPWSAITIGLVIAPLVAFAATPLASTELTRRLQPGRPHVSDLTVMLPGTLFGLVVLAAAAWLAARRTDARATTAEAHPAVINLPGPAGLFGGRVASGWGTPAARTVARSHVTGVAIGLAALTGVAVWSSAARHLVSTPTRYGVTWDATISPTQSTDGTFPLDPALLDGVADRLAADPIVGTVVARIAVGMYEGFGPGGHAEILEIDRASSAWWPTLIAGRAPPADDEVTVGAVIPAGVGDTIDLGGRRLTVVGKHVVSPLSNGGPGGSVAISTSPGSGLPLSLTVPALFVRLARGATIDDISRMAGDGFVVTESAHSPPGDVANLGRTRGLTDLLLAACAALGLAAFANGLIVATNARRDDHATLRALGARQRTIAGSVAWHGGLVAMVGAALGVPIGILIGRTVWRRTTSGINAVPDLWRWGVVAAAVALGAVFAASLVVVAIVAIPGRRPSARLPE